MAVTYASTTKTNRLNAVQDQILTRTTTFGTGGTTPYLIIGNSSLSGTTGILANIALTVSNVTVSGSVLTLVNASFPVSAVASATDTAAKAEVRNNASGTVISGLTVGTSASDIILGSVAIQSGQTVTINSGVINHA